MTVDQLAGLIDRLVNSTGQTFSSELPVGLFDTRFNTSAMTLAPAVVIPASSLRWGLVIGGPNANAYRLGFDSSITSALGIFVPQNNPPLEWIGNIWRPVVSRDIWGISLAVGQTLSWIEIFQVTRGR